MEALNRKPAQIRIFGQSVKENVRDWISMFIQTTVTWPLSSISDACMRSARYVQLPDLELGTGYQTPCKAHIYHLSRFVLAMEVSLMCCNRCAVGGLLRFSVEVVMLLHKRLVPFYLHRPLN